MKNTRAKGGMDAVENVYSDGEDLICSGVTCDGSPKVSISSPLVSPSTTINMPRGLYIIDVAATFKVPLTTVGDLPKLINDIKAGKHDELLFGMTNNDHDSINRNVDESTIPSDPIVQSVDINTKSTSYVGATGASAKDQPKVNSNFRTLVDDPVFDGVNISILRKVVEKEVDLVDVVTIGIPYFYGDGFTKETIRVEYEWRPPRCDICKIFGHVHEHCPKKVKKRRGKSKSTNDGQFAGTSVKLNVRYEPKATTSAPKKGVTNVGNTSQSASMLKTIGNSSKKDNLSMYNSFSALNDEEDV
ncbi:zinc knuckle CX2CX4HX4C containing protein [Tanacetum coccineum]